MHPDFQNVFAVPRTHKPLLYVGTTDNGWWNNGVLRTADEMHSYDVLDDIPNFVDPSVRAWTEEEMEEIKRATGLNATGKVKYSKCKSNLEELNFVRE